MSVVDKQQNNPKPGQRVVLSYLKDNLLPNAAWADINKDLTRRAKTGKKKYGTYLMSFNGRNPMLDLYQELLDGIMYSTQAFMETENQTEAEWMLDIVHVLIEEAYGVRQYLIDKGVNLDG